MPIAMSRRIYCGNCRTYIKTERFGDALSPDDIKKMHFSYCTKCKNPFWKEVLKTIFSRE